MRQRPSTLEVDAVQAAVQARLFRRESDGPRLGRYRLIRPLGAGGLGVVFEALDPELERVVAIKLMRQRDGMGDEEIERFAREAAAMARVSDPHVVAVFDVGRYDRGDLDTDDATTDIPDAGIFIVMERVEGDDLKSWLRSSPRSPAEILRVFRAAGRGLAAAHAVDIVHRDFKPQNVMVTAAGAKVLDFGLARLLGAGTDPDPLDTSVDALSGDPLGGSLTRPGIVMGTPAYMAPEQHAGRAVGPAADQYAFCVALAEALLGERLFEGPTMEALHERKLAYVLPKSAAITGAIRAAISRGLKPRPEDRFASMNALLDALAPRRARSGLLALGVATAAVGVGLVAMPSTSSVAVVRIAAIDLDAAAPPDRDRFARDDIREHDLTVRELVEEGRHHELVAMAESLRPSRADDPLLYAWTQYWACHGFMRLEDYPAAEAACELAYDTAADLGHTMLAAKSAMVAAECYSREQDPTAMLWQRHAVAMVERGDLEPYHAAYVLDGIASVLLSFGQDPTELQRRAIALREEADGPDAPALVPQLHNYVRALVGQDRAEEAEPVARRMIEIAAGLPDDRLERAMAEQNLGDVLCLTGRREEGLEWLGRAIARFDAHFRDVHPGGLAIALKEQAQCLAGESRWAEAIAAEARALEIGRASSVRRHDIELRHLVNIARWHVAAGEPDRAREVYREALAVVDPDDAEPALRVEAREELAALDRG